MKKFLISVTVLLLLAAGVTYLSLFILIDYIHSPSNSNTQTTVIIEKGSSVHKIAQTLFDNGVIKRKRMFEIYCVLKKKNAMLQAGEYLFEPHQTPQVVIQKLVKGEKVIHKMTIIEGTTTKEIIRMLKKNPLLSGEIITKPEDGRLFPSTYYYSYHDDRETLLKKILDEMKKEVTRLWDNRSPKVKLKSHAEAMILASIVEKEAANDAEKPLVAAVFHNRLQKKMRLQADPTITYALLKDHNINRRILTKEDLNYDSPYNTYRYPGLPPTPICNPGAKSIQAALHPADVNYLFFVSDGNGGHEFSSHYKQHAEKHNNLRKLRKELAEKKSKISS